MPMYNLIEYGENYFKTLGGLWQYCRNEQDNNITNSKSLRLEETKDFNVMNDGRNVFDHPATNDIGTYESI